MRSLIKVLAIVVAVLIVFWVVSALMHVLYLIGVGVVIAAAIFLAYKGWDQYKKSRQRHDERREERMRERAARRPGRSSIEAGRSIEPGPRIDSRRSIEAPRQQPGSLPGQFDVDEELARLKREAR